jgi:hypothetical protein
MLVASEVLPIDGPPGEDQQVRAVQPAQLLVEIGKPGGKPGQPAIALIGRVGDVHRVGRGLQEALEAALGLACLGQGVEPLLGLDDLFVGALIDIDARGPVGNLCAKRDQFAPDRQIVDHLRIVARSEAGDCRAGEAQQIGGAAKRLEPLVVFQKRLQRDRRGQRVLLDPRGGQFEDAGMDGVVEMLRRTIAAIRS